ncbi:MAG: protein kinase [Vicinamibacterales bacterium]
MALQPGSRIGGYEIVSPLGAGGMGEVYRAHDSQLGRDVAVKTLPAAFAADPERVARFEREARILATLNHPNIATLFGFEKQSGVLALVMELVEGDTLHDALARTGRGLPLREAIGIARQIVDGLDAAHEKGIVHRDLKPANVKITADGVVKVLDFGLAKAVASESSSHQTETRTLSPAETRPNAVLGTAAYMSPEQARGQALDRRTDIWAFGCVVYEMLAGQPAFARSTSSDTIAAVLTGEVDWSVLPPAVPPALRMLLQRCLERTTKARLRDIADARPYLDEAASPSALSASGAMLPAAPAAKPGVSRRALFASSAALGLVGAGLGATFGGTRRDPPPVLPSFQRLTFRRGVIRTARFAPDYQTVLYGALWDGDVARVYTVRADSPESAALSLPAALPLAVSSTGELALALGPHLRGIMTYGTLARVPLAGGAPRELRERVKFADWSPDGRDLAIVRGDGNRDVLEFPAGTAIAEPDAPRGFSFVRVSPRGDQVAAFALDTASWLSGKVVVFDRGGKRLAESAPFFNVFGLAWRGDEVWFTAADELPLLRNAVHAMDARGAVRVVTRVPGNTSLHDIAPDGRVLIARTDDRGGISVRVPGESVERDLAWFDSPNIVDLSADGRRVLFWEGGVGGGPRNSVYLRDTDGSPAVRLGDGVAHALSPDGQWALAYSGGSHLDLLPVGAGAARRIERSGVRLQVGRFLPDGRRIVALAQEGRGPARLCVLDIDGTAITPITPEGLSVSYFGWRISPDGSAVAVARPDGPELFPVAGGASRRIPGATGASQVIGWIHGGLIVTADPVQSSEAFLLDPVTGRRQPWAEFRPGDPAGLMNVSLYGLATTPDGRGYGYTWHRATSDLFLVRGWS